MVVPEDRSTRGGPQAAGFRHTSGLRVGVLEVGPATQAGTGSITTACCKQRKQPLPGWLLGSAGFGSSLTPPRLAA